MIDPARPDVPEPGAFAIGSALALGLLFPGLETMRRGLHYWSVDFTTMFEDYLAGGLLLLGAALALRRARAGVAVLTVAWAYATGMMGGSFWHQLEELVRGIDAEAGAGMVVAVKAALWATCVASTLLGLRALVRAGRAL